MKLPKIRENLLVQDLSDEVLIYDKTTDKSYCLNSTAKMVFNACDGKKTLADLKLPKGIVYLSLDELRKQGLIQDDYVSPFAGMTRREVVKSIGFAGMIALPLISSLIAPSAANAASSSVCTPNAPGCVARGGAYTNSPVSFNYCFSPSAASRCCSCRSDFGSGYTYASSTCRTSCT